MLPKQEIISDEEISRIPRVNPGSVEYLRLPDGEYDMDNPVFTSYELDNKYRLVAQAQQQADFKAFAEYILDHLGKSEIEMMFSMDDYDALKKLAQEAD